MGRSEGRVWGRGGEGVSEVISCQMQLGEWVKEGGERAGKMEGKEGLRGTDEGVRKKGRSGNRQFEKVVNFY